MDTFTRDQVIQVARSWIGTPYKHMYRVKGAGCDCIGLIVGVHNELYTTQIESLPIYTPWWAEETGQDLIAESMRNHNHGVEIGLGDANVGDVFIMRMKDRGPAKHCGFFSYNNRIIHSYSGHNVIETDLPDSWRRRIKYVFRFSGITD